MGKGKSNLRSIGLWCIGFLVAYLGERILDTYGFYSWMASQFVGNRLDVLTQPSLSYGEVIVFLIVLVVARYFLGLVKVDRKASIQRRLLVKQQKMEAAFCQSFKFIPAGKDLVFETDIRFIGQDIHLKSAYPYCALHGEVPQRMVYRFNAYECPVPGCDLRIPNSPMYSDNMENIQARIYSWLKIEWSKQTDLN